MKLFPITAALCLLASAASAQDMETICADEGRLAETIMTERQSGAVMTDIYDEPRWEGAETKANAILDFRNAVEHDCFTGD